MSLEGTSRVSRYSKVFTAQALDWLEARSQDASAKMMTVIKPRRALLDAVT